MKILTLILSLAFIASTNAQYLASKAIEEDLNFLINNIEKYNPALSVYHPEFREQAKKVLTSVKGDSASVYDYFTKVSHICALANEGHFKLGDWKDIAHKAVIEDKIGYLPLATLLTSKKLYVLKDISNERQLKKGDEIVAINGMSMEDILILLLKVTPSDGDITTYAYKKIDDGFNWMYLLYIEQPDSFSIDYLTKGGESKTANIKALIRSNQFENFEKYYGSEKQEPSTDEGFYKLSYKDDYAILTLPSFDFRRVNKYDVDAKKLYKTLFTEFNSKGLQHLIIDLRDNTGGRNEFANAIVPYIMKQNSTDEYMKKTISWAGKEKVYKLPKPSKQVFKHNIYVLVNGKTYSAGSSLTRYLKEYGNATVIGTETGTRYDGFAAGSEHNIILPNSNITIGIPRYHILFPKSKIQQKFNRGLIPDYEINYTFQDYLENRDLHKEKAIEIIKSR